ncbi:MAG: RsmB/NOP family class I SAM-dependent RNA methyltransferase [Lachnospiraceae bacterium]|nr:RsmB/NOP family class I SAM-dependent RNA methyltransferase [Lachnospiraceae bacterium]
MVLPESYTERIKKQLGEEYEEYLRSFEHEAENGLRVNTAKVSVEDFVKLCPFEIKPVPWVKNGFFYEGERPAIHPYYFAGLYYLQEPSAMTPASILPVTPGERVLDLCAAPGGKSTELAAKLKGQGVLVSNDVSSTRAKALLKNLELFGTPNALVVSETPQKLCEVFEGYFDKILVDAPCSGEGMFRKKAAIVKNWEQYGTGYYHAIQSEILPYAVKMLRPGGMLLYSTCTFSPEEDEGSVQEILDAFPEIRVLDAAEYANGADLTGFEHGNPDWIENGSEELRKTLRLWPHKIRGEGHFVALLQKGEDREESGAATLRVSSVSKPSKAGKFPAEVYEFFDKLHYDIDFSRIEQRGEQIFMLPKLGVSVKGLRILRSGLLLGEIKTKRFEPSQALACAIKAKDFDNRLELKAEDERVLKYLKCETLEVEEKLENGLVLVCVDGFPLGWGKYSNGNFKNRYFAGWRHM